MKLGITSRNLPSSTNYNRTIPSYCPNIDIAFNRVRHLSRCKLWMTSTNNPRKRSLIILHLHLLTHRAKLVLRIVQLYAHMISRSSNSIPNDSNSVHRICPTMRSNVILRCNCNYKSPIRNSICRKGGSTMSMRGFRGRQHYTYTILRTTLPNTLCNRSNSIDSSTIPTPNRIKQPIRIKQKCRQNPIPSILYTKRHLRICNHHHSPNDINPKRTVHPKRPGQLHPSKPSSNTHTHSTRMIFPIRICNLTINPK